MADAEVIRETIAVARENRHRFNMASWAYGQVNPEATTWRECNTTACLGGWRTLLDGLRPVADSGGYSDGLWFVNPATGEHVTAEDWAARRMDLDPREVSALFYATWLGADIDAVEELAEMVIAGSWKICYECNDGDNCDVCGRLGIVPMPAATPVPAE